MPYGETAEIDLATITDRMAVRKAVQNGNVEDAIEKVNDLNFEVYIINASLFLSFLWEILKNQKLTVLADTRQKSRALLSSSAAKGDWTYSTREALEFAQEELSPRCSKGKAWLLRALLSLRRIMVIGKSALCLSLVCITF